MDLFKKHVDTVIIMGGILSSFLWMNGKFNQVDEKFAKMSDRLGTIENRLAKIETILIMKGLATHDMLAIEKEKGK